MDAKYVIKSGILGTVVGDALGVPVEFSMRADRKSDPVTSMREYGTHNQPKGTWSDDSSMAIATMDSIIRNGSGQIDYDDIMVRFNDWRLRGEYTPYGRCFDIGITTSKALSKYASGENPLNCGGDRDMDNGNGSVMRIMPASLYVILCSDSKWPDHPMELVHNISSLTHRHIRNQIGCGIYTFICRELINRENRTLAEAVDRGIRAACEYYTEKLAGEYAGEWDKYKRLEDISAFAALPEEEIKSSGYVVDTLEAAVWCLLNSHSYAECVLNAVNLGDDTDTVGAVTGGLAGLWYGYDGIPEEWLGVIAKLDWIEGLCDQFADVLSRTRQIPYDDPASKLSELKKIDFEIGGFFGGTKVHSFFFEGDRVNFARDLFRMPDPLDEEEHVGEEMTRDAFIEALKAIHMENWNDSYEDMSVLDGTQWELMLEYDDSTKRVISGSNDYPDNFIDLLLLLNKVTGGDFDSELEA